MSELHRGEIYYISRGGASPQGSEQYPDRPAVIVSNERNNEYSNTVEVVYMTTQPKADLPTHVTIRSTGRTSTVLCEAIYSVSVDRVQGYIAEVSEQEMQNIDIALMISLQLDGDTKTTKRHQEEQKRQQEEIERLKADNESLKAKIAEYGENTKPKEETMTSNEFTVRIQTERDTYKALYEQLFERLVNGGAA